MRRPTGWQANPQAMAAASKRIEFTGSDLLATRVDGDTWLTPRWILDRLGAFHLDPCAADAQPHWVAPLSFQKEDDGLRQLWAGRVFMNPPFSGTAPWLRRHAEHAQGISLVPASVESVVWRETVWVKAKAILLMHGRTRFANPDGSTTTGRPLRSIALIAWADPDASVLRDSQFAGTFLSEWSLR